jgi:hypothetical protein
MGKEMIEIIKSMFLSPQGTLSSKRATGFLMITLAGFLISISVINKQELTPNNTGLIRDLIYGGVALVGSTIFEKRFKNKENANG